MQVLVTGANGHLGYNLTKELLTRGYKVRASVRSLADRAKTESLRALGGVELVEIDVLRPDTFRAPIRGVDVFFHTAAVYSMFAEHGDEEAEIVRPSIDGVANAIRTAAEARVPKVVLTSSVVTLPLTKPGAPPSTEDGWTDDLQIPYFRAKTLAEKRAWELARELNVNLVTVLPGGIVGPGFQRNTPTLDLIEAIMFGGMRLAVPNANFSWVDVRDAVSAHVLAAEKNCSGRFIACNDKLHFFAEVIDIMRGYDPSIPRPMTTLPSFLEPFMPLFDRLNSRMLGTPRAITPEAAATVRGKIWNASNARIKRELGWKPSIPFEISLRDSMDMIRKNRMRRAA